MNQRLIRTGQMVRYSDHFRTQQCTSDEEPHSFGVIVEVEVFDGDEPGTIARWPRVMWQFGTIPSLCHPLNVTAVWIVEHKDEE